MLLAAGAGLAGAITATDAAAQSCAAVTVSQGQGFSFDVSSVLVPEGGCVRFANLTDVTVTITVSGSSFSEKEPARTPASASATFVARKSAVTTASDGVRTGHGDITVEKAESQPTAPPYSPPPTTASGSGPGTGSGPSAPAGSGSGGGSVAGSSGALEPPASVASIGPNYVPTAPPDPSGALGVVSVPSLPLRGAASGPPTVSHPVVAPQLKSDDPRLTSTVLDPVGGPRRGLPATVAAVLLLGLAAAYGRAVLAAAPVVDSRATRRPIRT